MPSIQAGSALGLLRSIGVATHVDSGAANWTDTRSIIRELSYLGVNQIRDGTPFDWTLSAFVTLAKAGIKLDLQLANQYTWAGAGIIDVATDVKNAAQLQKLVPGSVIALEGANEYNINHWYYNGKDSYGNLQWSAAVDAALNASVQANGALKGLAVVASSTAGLWSISGSLPNESRYISASNLHVYAGVGEQLQATLAAEVALARQTNPGRSIYITEGGISSSGYGSSQAGVASEYAQGIIDTNLLLDAYKSGVAKTFLYDLMDEAGGAHDRESHFGLFRTDGSAKPAALDIHNLTSILADPGTGPSQLGSLNYSISGLPQTASSTLLQKSDGTFEIIIWNSGVAISDGKTDLTVQKFLVTVTFASNQQLVNLYDPIISSSALKTAAGTQLVSFYLGAEPIIVEVPPVPVAPSIVSVSPDTGLSGDHITNAKQLVIAGKAQPASKVQIYDGSTKLGTVVVGADGNWSYTTAKLADGKHAFSTKAINAAGNVSPASAASSITIDTVAPAAPKIVSDALGSSNTMLVSGTAEAGSKIAVYEGTRLLGSGMANAQGNWTVKTIWLAAGVHNFAATATDTAGNVSRLSSTFDPVIGTVIESAGSVNLVQVGKNYYLSSGGKDLLLKYGGVVFVDGQFGAWKPRGVETTATGYDVAWKNSSSGLYTVWSVDKSGNWASDLLSNVSGSSAAFKAMETLFHQDLNGDGVINSASTVIDVSGKLALDLGNMSQAATIAAGASLELTGAVSGSITFKAVTGTLILDKSTQFTGKIYGLSGDGNPNSSDILDLRDIAYGTGTKVSFSGDSSGGVLTVTDAQNHAAHLTLVGDYTHSTFNLSSDGAGGTLVIDPPMSGFNFAPAPAAVSATTPLAQHDSYIGGADVHPQATPGVSASSQSIADDHHVMPDQATAHIQDLHHFILR